MKVWLASVDIYGEQKAQVCASEQHALHWLAWEAITADDWVNYFRSLPVADVIAENLTPDRVGMTAEQIIYAWTGEAQEEDSARTWGQGDCYMRIEAQDVYGGH